MTWQRGKPEVEGLIDQGDIEQVLPSDPLAERLLSEAQRHLAAAGDIVDRDPTGSFQLVYDASRKACSALLAVQGLRATTRGGHIAVEDVVRAQFDGDFHHFQRLRRRRRDSEYPEVDSPTTTVDDARDASATAAKILGAARRLIDSGQLDRF